MNLHCPSCGRFHVGGIGCRNPAHLRNRAVDYDPMPLRGHTLHGDTVAHRAPRLAPGTPR